MSATTVGVDLGGTKVLVRIARPAQQVIVERLPTGPGFGPQSLIELLRRMLELSDPAATSIGIAVPGLVGEEQTVIACDVLPQFVGWSSADLAGLAARSWLVNDAEAALLEESRASGHANAAMIMVGTGIGAAFMSGGRIVKGTCGWAGELGYLPVVHDGRVTTLDCVAAGQALTERTRLGGEQLRARLEAGDPVVRAAVEEAGCWLGLGIAAVVNLLNPGLVIVAGGTTRLPGYLDAAFRSAQERALPPLWACCEVRGALAGEEVVARGAALGSQH